MITHDPIITEKLYNRLKKFAPFYARQMKKGKMPMDGLSIHESRSLLNANSCIVGEVYDFTNGYSVPHSSSYCLDCTKFAGNLAQSFKTGFDYTDVSHESYNSRFLLELTSLIKHLEAIHSELCIETRFDRFIRRFSY